MSAISIGQGATGRNRATFFRSTAVRLSHEIRTTWALFSTDNASITVLPGLLLTVSMWSVADRDFEHFPVTIIKSFLFFFFYGYTFVLSNQLAGLEEDRLNKPHRPLVRGMVTQSGMKWRLIFAATIFLSAGIWCGNAEYAVLWMLVTFLHNQLHWSRFWVFKSTTMFFGTVSMMAAPAKQVGVLDSTIWRWIIIISAYNFFLIIIQDLRDVEGDKAVGRRTVPLIIGGMRTRVALAFGLLMYPVVDHYTMAASPRVTVPALLFWDAVIAAFSLILSVRLIFNRDKRADQLTYLIFCYQWAAVCVAPAFVWS